jgi:hypothetical protein
MSRLTRLAHAAIDSPSEVAPSEMLETAEFLERVARLLRDCSRRCSRPAPPRRPARGAPSPWGRDDTDGPFPSVDY